MRSLNVKVYDSKGNLFKNINYPDGIATTIKVIHTITTNEGEKIETGVYKMKNMKIQLQSYNDTLPSVNEENYPFSRLINDIKSCPNSGYYRLKNIVPGRRGVIV